MGDPSPAATPIHLSKTIIETWQRCPLAYKYQHVDRLDARVQPSPAHVLAATAQELTATLLQSPLALESEGTPVLVDSVLSHCDLTPADATRVAELAISATFVARMRGGHLQWVEQLLHMQRMPGVVLWAKFDAAIIGGVVAPIEVLDFQFGIRPPAETEQELRASTIAQVYRLVAGDAEPDQRLRPIAVSQIHVPTGHQVTVIPTDAEVQDAYALVREVGTEIRAAREAGTFEARPGVGCLWCGVNSLCEVAPLDRIPF